ncbi:Cytochrome P [Trema orientale]|uniref:Cytochrome P n=1 Tax=Trema orientale TaxID=63057 RepID=A0A2P5FVP8_TREOI|nr:Cytochrome P [Trema orientale]
MVYLGIYSWPVQKQGSAQLNGQPVAELLCHPKLKIKGKAELDLVVGSNRKGESGINNLLYLHGVTEETLSQNSPVP